MRKNEIKVEGGAVEITKWKVTPSAGPGELEGKLEQIQVSL